MDSYTQSTAESTYISFASQNFEYQGPTISSPMSSQSVREPTRFANARQQFRAIIYHSWINLLLLAIPAGFVLHYTSIHAGITFGISFLAMIPLASLLGFATEQISLHIGGFLGGLLTATCGNIPELIISIIALKQHKQYLVQTSLIGGILSNALLVLGTAFFGGQLRFPKQHFDEAIGQDSFTLFSLSIGVFLVFTFGHSFPGAINVQAVDNISRGISILLVCAYGYYLWLQIPPFSARSNSSADTSIPSPEAVEAGAANDMVAAANGPILTTTVSAIVISLTIALIIPLTDFLVGSITAFTKGAHIPETFVALIVLPIVGNAAEHVTAITTAYKGKIDITIGIAVGSSVQIASFLLPVVILISWGINGKQMTLDLDVLQATSLAITIVLLSPVMSTGKIGRFSGLALVVFYIVIAVIAFFWSVV